jgi:hypothetical protein
LKSACIFLVIYKRQPLFIAPQHADLTFTLPDRADLASLSTSAPNGLHRRPGDIPEHIP